jgi:hypothetical protein
LPEVRRTGEARPEYCFGLIYGVAKLGKTTIVAETTPDPKLILATEDGDSQGLQSIQDLNVPYLEIRDWPTFELVHTELMKNTTVVGGKLVGKCQYKGEEYPNIIVDSYSCCGHLWWDMALSQLGWNEVGLGRGRAGLQPYSYVAEKGRQATKRLMMLRANVTVVAREGVAESGMGTEDYKSVPCIELPGNKLFNELPGSFDFVVRLRQINGKRVFVTAEEGGAIAGVRLPKEFGTIDRYVKPNVGDLQKAVLGDKEALNRLKLDVTRTSSTPAVVNRR